MGLLSFADPVGAAYALLQWTGRSLGAARTVNLAIIPTTAYRAFTENLWLWEVL